jgi:error-prone DNA polymerase
MAQFDKEDVEVLGLLKLDVLGVRMQSAMAHAVTEVHRATGERLDLDALPLSPGDPATYRLIRSTETLGCFQIESPGQRDLVGRLQPCAFHDLVVDISLFRPGPVSADMVTPFVEAHNGRAPVRHPHPDLADVLRETYGVVVFHEQVIDIIAIMTGCDRAEADEMRRELSDPELRGGARVRFGAAARARGRGTEEIRRVWDIVASFGAYGFSKAHAVAFAVPTYQSAWLKTHHPAAFYAGLLTHDPGMYPKRLLLADARRRGVPLLPLDVNHSDTVHRIELVSGKGGSDGPVGPGEPPATGSGEPARPTGRARRGHRPRAGRPAERTRPRADPGPEPGGPGPETGAPGGAVWGVRLALGDVHGISAAEAERIAAGRPYSSLLDLWQRARPGRPLAERLAQVGALDSFGPNRRDLLLRIEELHRGGRAAGTTGGQLPLAAVTDHAAPAGLPDLDVTERLGAELSVLGMDTSRHLMADHRALLAELGALTADRLRATRHGQTVLVAGAKAATQTPPIRSGRRVVFTTLDDGTGLVDCAFFEDSHAACAHTVFHSWLLLIRGTLHRRGPRSHSVSGTAAWDLAELAELRRTGGLDAVAARLAQAPGAASPAGVNGADPARPVPDASDPTGGRRLHLPTGYRLHPWADLRPAGEGLPTGRKLWHASPGSAG